MLGPDSTGHLLASNEENSGRCVRKKTRATLKIYPVRLADMEPEAALEAILGGTGVEEARPDTISDPGVEGGVDAPNEEPKELETEA